MGNLRFGFLLVGSLLSFLAACDLAGGGGDFDFVEAAPGTGFTMEEAPPLPLLASLAGVYRDTEGGLYLLVPRRALYSPSDLGPSNQAMLYAVSEPAPGTRVLRTQWFDRIVIAQPNPTVLEAALRNGVDVRATTLTPVSEDNEGALNRLADAIADLVIKTDARLFVVPRLEFIDGANTRPGQDPALKPLADIEKVAGILRNLDDDPEELYSCLYPAFNKIEVMPAPDSVPAVTAGDTLVVRGSSSTVESRALLAARGCPARPTPTGGPPLPIPEVPARPMPAANDDGGGCMSMGGLAPWTPTLMLLLALAGRRRRRD